MPPRFARRVYSGTPGREGLGFIDSLLLDERPVAMTVNIASGRTAYSPKSAYDAAWRRLGPGLLLDYLAIELFYSEGAYDAFDSATTAEGHALDELWNERRQMVQLVIGPAGWRTRALATRVERSHQVRSVVKQSLGLSASGVRAQLSRLRRLVSSTT